MARYVDIENCGALVEVLSNMLEMCHFKHKEGCIAPDCRDCLHRHFNGFNSSHLIPTADVRPERHGRWSDKMIAVKETAVGYHNDDVRFGFQCSACGGVLNYKTKYCGNCGAKMDGEENAKTDN